MRDTVVAGQVFRRVLREHRPSCATCGKTPEITNVDEHYDSEMFRITFLCHNAVDYVSMKFNESVLLGTSEAIRAFVAQLPKLVFLQNWAAYKTTTRPERRAVR